MQRKKKNERGEGRKFLEQKGKGETTSGKKKTQGLFQQGIWKSQKKR